MHIQMNTNAHTLAGTHTRTPQPALPLLPPDIKSIQNSFSTGAFKEYDENCKPLSLNKAQYLFNNIIVSISCHPVGPMQLSKGVDFP